MTHRLPIRTRDLRHVLAVLSCRGIRTGRGSAARRACRRVHALTIIDGTGAPKANQTCWSVATVSRRWAFDCVGSPQGARTVDSTGRFMIPGLGTRTSHAYQGPITFAVVRQCPLPALVI